MCLSNFKAIRQFKVPISWLRDFTRSYEKTPFRILRRGPVLGGLCRLPVVSCYLQVEIRSYPVIHTQKFAFAQQYQHGSYRVLQNLVKSYKLTDWDHICEQSLVFSVHHIVCIDICLTALAQSCLGEDEIHLHFLSFCKTEMVQVVEIISRKEENPFYTRDESRSYCCIARFYRPSINILLSIPQ